MAFHAAAPSRWLTCTGTSVRRRARGKRDKRDTQLPPDHFWFVSFFSLSLQTERGRARSPIPSLVSVIRPRFCRSSSTAARRLVGTFRWKRLLPSCNCLNDLLCNWIEFSFAEQIDRAVKGVPRESQRCLAVDDFNAHSPV